MSSVPVQLHASAAELAGTRHIGVEIALPATAGEVKSALAARVPALGDLLPACALATDAEYLRDSTSIVDDAPLHLIPPVSGG